MVPFGRAGTDFVKELTSLFNNYGTASSMECIALKAAMVMPALLLQRPHRDSKSRDHVACLERRLPLWRNGNIKSLLDEGITRVSSQNRKMLPYAVSVDFHTE